MGKPGVYETKKKDGSTYYRSSITFRGKHISLGSFLSEEEAHFAYIESEQILNAKDQSISIEAYREICKVLSFEKWVSLLNFKKNNVYCKNPIFLKSRYFIYFLDEYTQLKFDVDDLFYYSHHKIMRRGGYLFVSDYGMQVNILSRYGIKNFAVADKDYRFVNGDNTDYRYGNIEIINPYYGVAKIEKNGFLLYLTKIHINGDVIVGKYHSETEAAIAYNKAADILLSKGVQKKFIKNYLTDLDEIEYARLYNQVRISKYIRTYTV